ncbi:YceG family protein [Anaeromassilibacillus senegalensis]|uniref:YceG family protein n=1 Tax=Anaeromassilibacillus senegalensis TaxID=1673717 RepID=UPI00068048D3|nr:YceG family protein [Anaeromassilibacillus senegalensis]
MTGPDPLQIFFLDLDKRTPPRPLFYRIIGRDKEGAIDRFIDRYRTEATREGLYFHTPLSNPPEAQIQKFYDTIGTNFSPTPQLAVRHLTVWMGQLRPAQREKVAHAMEATLEALRKQNHANDTIIRNTYIKLMCWMRETCSRVLMHFSEHLAPKVLYEGTISKYEVYLLHLLHLAGCDVVFLNWTSDETYLKADPHSAFSTPVYNEIRTEPAKAVPSPAARPIPAPVSNAVPVRPRISLTRPGTVPSTGAGNLRHSLQGMGQTVNINGWAKDADPFEAVLLPNSRRSTTQPPAICNLFVFTLGAQSREEYRNRLFSLKNRLASSGKTWGLVENRIPPPTNEEIALFRDCNRSLPADALAEQLASRLLLPCGKLPTMLAQRAFLSAMDRLNETDSGKLYNQGVRLACWMRRYGEKLFAGYRADLQPVFLYYGTINTHELSLLWAMASMGTDVLYFCPDLSVQATLGTNPLIQDARTIVLPNTLPVEPFPQHEERVRAATVAYKASQELDQILYTDTGMFRNRQFTRSVPVTLKTTIDEVGILWKEQAQFRPCFETESGAVKVPNIFAKICGVDGGDMESYWDRIQDMITDKTFLVDRVPFFSQLCGTKAASPDRLRQFVHNGKIDPTQLKRASIYQYAYLPEDTQDYILEKIQMMIDCEILKSPGKDLPIAALAVLLNLNQALLQTIQAFDFTQHIPKLMIIDTTENVFSLEDCILTAFLNLVGFDIAVFTPTGYRNLETYINEDSFEIYQAGDFVFHQTAPDLRNRKRAGGSSAWLSKLFGKGRN